jgi:ArsR family transcriptional regulator
VLARRRDATQIYYSIADQRAASVCRSVCTQIAMDMVDDDVRAPRAA